MCTFARDPRAIRLARVEVQAVAGRPAFSRVVCAKRRPDAPQAARDPHRVELLRARTRAKPSAQVAGQEPQTAHQDRAGQLRQHPRVAETGICHSVEQVYLHTCECEFGGGALSHFFFSLSLSLSLSFSSKRITN